MNRIQRTLLNVVAPSAVSAGCALILTRSLLMTGLGILVGCLLGVGGIRLAAIVVGGLASISIGSLGVTVWSFLDRTYVIDAPSLTIATTFTGAVVAWRLRDLDIAPRMLENLLALAFLAAAIWMSTRNEGSREVLTRLASMGEDNGSFLSNIAVTLGETRVKLIPGSGGDAGSNGGIVLAIIVAICAALYRGLGWLDSSTLDPAILLLRMYDLLVIACVVLGALVTVSLLRKVTSIAALIPIAGTSGLVSLAFAMGFVRAGHLTALLLAVWLLSCVVVLLAMPDSTWASALGMGFIIFAGQIWQPASIIAFACLFFYLVGQIENNPNSGCHHHGRKRLAMCLGLVAVSALINYGFLGFLAGGSAFDVAGYGGRNSVVNWQLAFVMLGVTAIASINRSVIEYQPMRYLVPGLLVSAAAVMLLGWFIEPFDPQYGAEKLTYVAAFVTAPVFVAFIGTFVLLRIDAGALIRMIVSSAIVVGIFLAAINPVSYLSRVLQAPVQPDWVAGVTRALRSYPDKTVVCIDTREGGRLDDAYTCSRLMMGIAGMHPPQGNWSNHTSGSLPPRQAPSLLTGANICWVSSQQIADIADSEWGALTLVVGDPQRLSSSDDCQRKGWSAEGKPDDLRWLLGWLTAIPWSEIPVFSYGGERVIPSFEYLKSSPYYDSKEIAILEGSLKI